MHTVTCPGLSARSDRHRVANWGRHRSPPQTHGHVLLPLLPPHVPNPWPGLEWRGGFGRVRMRTTRWGPDRAGSLAALPRGSVPGWRTRSPPAASGPARPSQTPRVELGRRGGSRRQGRVSSRPDHARVRVGCGARPVAAPWTPSQAPHGTRETGHQPGEAQETGGGSRCRVLRGRTCPSTPHLTRISRAPTACRSPRPGKGRCRCPGEAAASRDGHTPNGSCSAARRSPPRTTPHGARDSSALRDEESLPEGGQGQTLL